MAFTDDLSLLALPLIAFLALYSQEPVQRLVLSASAMEYVMGLAARKIELGERGYRDYMKSASPIELSICDPITHIALNLTPPAMHNVERLVYQPRAVSLLTSLCFAAQYMPDGFPLPQLRHITIFSAPPQLAQPSGTFTLSFSRPDLDTAAAELSQPVLTCLTGTWWGSETGSTIAGLLHNKNARRFVWHVDAATLDLPSSEVEGLLQSLPIPERCEHMVVTLPTIYDPQMTRRRSGNEVNAHARDNLFWLQCLVQILRERKGTPMVLEIVGGYTEWRLAGETLRTDDDWDGIPHNASFKDKSWRLVESRLVDTQSRIGEDDKIDNIVEKLCQWARGLPVDHPDLAPYRGAVYIAIRQTRRDAACQYCRLRHASVRPFKQAARLPEWANIPVQQPKVAVYGALSVDSMERPQGQGDGHAATE